MKVKSLNILLLGDVFDDPGVEMLEQHLPRLKEKYNLDFVVAQAENASGRKGFGPKEYQKMKAIGVDAFTLGNHFLAKEKILKIIEKPEVIIPANLPKMRGGSGSRVFNVKGCQLRVTSMLGISFNLLKPPIEQLYADSFFDAADQILEEKSPQEDFHIVDFHAETTSEKAVFGLYLDGRVDVVVGTHTHVQTNDARLLPRGTFFMTDLGMVGPNNCAIGVNLDDVYQRMRYGEKTKFTTSKTRSQLNGVVVFLKKGSPTAFEVINIQ